jgi:hypothetical protein
MTTELIEMEVPESIYKGAGRAWVAVKDGKIIAAEYMGGYAYAGLDDLGRTRMTDAAREEIKIENDKRFEAWRVASRERLSALGCVVGGMMGSMRFYPNK